MAWRLVVAAVLASLGWVCGSAGGSAFVPSWSLRQPMRSLRQSRPVHTEQYLFGGAGTPAPPPTPAGGAGGGLMQNFEAIKKTQELFQKMKDLNEEMLKTEIEGRSDDVDKEVKIVYNGNGTPLRAEVSEGAASLDKDQLEEALTTALKDGFQKAGETRLQRIAKLYEEMGLPAEAMQKMMGQGMGL
mmetsp:Transcript_52395/g.131702  ORF Transcript_52395/g.131702 Transcript_52395/m.131702 type:complete len:187 (-) Transcript_52395:311-871(-)